VLFKPLKCIEPANLGIKLLLYQKFDKGQSADFFW